MKRRTIHYEITNIFKTLMSYKITICLRFIEHYKRLHTISRQSMPLNYLETLQKTFMRF